MCGALQRAVCCVRFVFVVHKNIDKILIYDERVVLSIRYTYWNAIDIVVIVTFCDGVRSNSLASADRP